MEFNERLVAERKRLGLSQTEFGEMAGVHRTAQANYESGARVPDIDYLQSVAKAGVDLLFLVVGQPSDESRLARTIQEQALLNVYRSIQPKAKVALLNIAFAVGFEYHDSKNVDGLKRGTSGGSNLLIQASGTTMQIAGLVSTESTSPFTDTLRERKYPNKPTQSYAVHEPPAPAYKVAKKSPAKKASENDRQTK